MRPKVTLFTRVMNTKSEEKFIRFSNLLGVPNKVHKVLQVLLKLIASLATAQKNHLNCLIVTINL